MEFCKVIKNKLLIHSTVRTNLKNIMLSTGPQHKRVYTPVILLMRSSITAKPHHGFTSWKRGCHSDWESEGTDWGRTRGDLFYVSVCGEESSTQVGESSASSY